MNYERNNFETKKKKLPRVSFLAYRWYFTILYNFRLNCLLDILILCFSDMSETAIKLQLNMINVFSMKYHNKRYYFSLFFSLPRIHFNSWHQRDNYSLICLCAVSNHTVIVQLAYRLNVRLTISHYPSRVVITQHHTQSDLYRARIIVLGWPSARSIKRIFQITCIYWIIYTQCLVNYWIKIIGLYMDSSLRLCLSCDIGVELNVVLKVFVERWRFFLHMFSVWLTSLTSCFLKI